MILENYLIDIYAGNSDEPESVIFKYNGNTGNVITTFNFAVPATITDIKLKALMTLK